MTLLGAGSFLRMHNEITRGISGGEPKKKKPSGSDVGRGSCPNSPFFPRPTLHTLTSWLAGSTPSPKVRSKVSVSLVLGGILTTYLTISGVYESSGYMNGDRVEMTGMLISSGDSVVVNTGRERSTVYRMY